MSTTSTTTPAIPHSREAEEAAIGSVLINPDALVELHFLSPEDFYIHRNKWIWESFVRLNRKRVPIDLLTVSTDLDSLGRLQEIGGPAYLTSLVNQVPTSLNAESYGRIIEGHSVRRKMIVAANEIAGAAYDLSQEVGEVIDTSLASVYKAADRQERKETRLGDALSQAYDQSERANKSGNLIGISTGFLDLDAYLGGLKPSKLYYVGGRPGMGKSAFILDMAIHAAFAHKKRVRIFSQEMDAIEIAIRVASKRLGIDAKRIEEGNLKPHEWEAYLALVDEVADYEKYPITIDETTPLTPLSMLAVCQNAWLRGDLDLVIVDYIQLLQGEGVNLREQVTNISRSTKRLARQLGIPVVGAVQLSRNAAEGDPKLHDLQETGALEQDADVVILLHGDKQVKSLVHASIAKHRGGPTGEVELVFRKHLVKFEDAARKDQRSSPAYVQNQFVEA